jgi:heme-degrading monooxygenase HmoA
MIRVIIERKIKPGKESVMWNILHDLRTKVLGRKGYVSGETLLGHDDRSLWVVIGTWVNAEYWQEWFNSSERQTIENQEKALLANAVKITIFDFIEELPGREEQEEKEEVESEAEEELEQK